ncbi:MAG: hypothetical protein ABL877_02315 [Thiobacillus sp.]
MFKKFKRKQELGYLAIQQGPAGLSSAEIHWRDQHPALTSCTTRDDSASSEKAWSRFAQSPVPISVVLTMGDYQLIPLDAPAVPPEELKMAVRWQIKDQIEHHIDDVTVDIVQLDSAASGKLLAVVAHNQLIRQTIQLAERANVPLAVVDIPELAQRNLARLFETPGSTIALLSITPQGGLLTIVRDGELSFYRRFECSAVASGRAVEAGAPEFDKLAQELGRSLDFIDRQYANWMIDHLLVSPTVEVPELPQLLSEQINLPVSWADLSQVLGNTIPAAPAEMARCWFALGGALRREAVAL